MIALVEDEDRDPYMIEYTRKADSLTVFRGFGVKPIPDKPKKVLQEPQTEEVRIGEPEPEDLESLMLLSCI